MARRKYSVDEALIARYRKEGRGTGFGADYLPWLEIGDVPSLGRSHRLRGAKTGRVHHFLSDIEVALFYVLDWQDAVSDIREQFPLDRDETQEIACRHGVGYPVDRHTRVPLVMTTDFLVDFSIEGSTRRVAYAVKLSKALTEARTAVRTAEKLEIERLYWLGKGVPWGIVTEAEISKPLVRNISWVHSYRDIEGFDNQPYPGYLAEKADLMLMELPSWRDASLRQACQGLDLRFAMQTGTALLLVRHLIASKRLLCDMTLPLDDSAPVSRFQVATAVQRVGRLG